MKTTTATKFKETDIRLIPQEWEFFSIDQLGKVVTGKTPSREHPSDWGDDFDFVTPSDIISDEKYLHAVSRKISKTGSNRFKNMIVPPESIMVTCIGSDMGKVIMNRKESLTNQQINSLIVKDSFVNNFIYYSLKNLYSTLWDYAGGGSTMPIINKSTFESLKIAVPKSVNEQKQIAEILSSLDDKIELNRKINANLENLAAALFKKWFVDIGDELPEGWRFSTIGKELETCLGGTPSRDKDAYWINGTIPWINSGKVNEFRITKPSEYITETGLNNSAAKLLPKGTVVIAITGATLGQHSLLEIDYAFNQSVVGIKENQYLKKEFIYFWIVNTIHDLINTQTGGAQQHINKQVVDSHKILIPEQNILNRYYESSRPIFDMISKNCFEIENLSTIRNSLLPRLMNGKIGVK